MLTVLNWASVALAAIGIALAVATVRERRLPWLLVVGLPALLGALMLYRAASGAGAAGDVAVLTGAADGSAYTARWDLVLWSPLFAAWGTAWWLAARAAARRRTAQARPAQRPPPAGARRLKPPPPSAGRSAPKPPRPPATSAPLLTGPSEGSWAQIHATAPHTDAGPRLRAARSIAA